MHAVIKLPFSRELQSANNQGEGKMTRPLSTLNLLLYMDIIG